VSRLSLQVFYLWRHVLLTAPPFILGWSNLEILFPFLHRREGPSHEGCAVKQFKRNMVRIYMYNRKNPKSSLYCEMSMAQAYRIYLQYSIYGTIVTVLLYGIQLMFVQRFQQLYFLIHYCCDNTRKVHAPNAGRRSGAPHMWNPDDASPNDPSP
jgi:hypothetical protein